MRSRQVPEMSARACQTRLIDSNLLSQLAAFQRHPDESDYRCKRQHGAKYRSEQFDQIQNDFHGE